MSGSTTELSLATAVDTDDNADYLTLSLANSLRTVDGLFNNVTGHNHGGAHQGAAVAPSAIPGGSITNTQLGPDVARANLLTNGSLDIWQRGNGPFAAAGAFCADRWQVYAPAGTTSVTNSTTAEGDSPYSAAVAITAPSTNGLYQIVTEGPNILIGKTVSLSLRVLCSQANSVRVGIQSNRAASLPTTWSSYHTGGGAWETLSVSYAVPQATTGVTVWILGSVAGTFYADKAMLVVGSQPANYVPLHPADDLARCLRYYEKIGPTANMPEVSLYQAAGSSFGQTLTWATKKALTPTITVNGTFAYVNASTVAISGPSVDGVFFGAQATALGAAIVYSNNSGFISAESNP